MPRPFMALLYFLNRLPKNLPRYSETVTTPSSRSAFAKKRPSSRQEMPLPKVKIPAEIPWVYAVWTVPMVDTPPTRVPMMIQETPVAESERSATAKSSADLTCMDLRTAIMLMQTKGDDKRQLVCVVIHGRRCSGRVLEVKKGRTILVGSGFPSFREGLGAVILPGACRSDCLHNVWHCCTENGADNDGFLSVPIGKCQVCHRWPPCSPAT